MKRQTRDELVAKLESECKRSTCRMFAMSALVAGERYDAYEWDDDEVSIEARLYWPLAPYGGLVVEIMRSGTAVSTDAYYLSEYGVAHWPSSYQLAHERLTVFASKWQDAVLVRMDLHGETYDQAVAEVMRGEGI